MKYLMIAAASLALVACGGAKDGADKMKDKAADAVETTTDAAGDAADSIDGALNGVSRGEWIDICAQAETMTAAKCECTLDAYADLGIDYKDMDNSDKMQAAMSSATPEQLTALGACVT
jgi:hypothetical protein